MTSLVLLVVCMMHPLHCALTSDHLLIQDHDVLCSCSRSVVLNVVSGWKTSTARQLQSRDKKMGLRDSRRLVSSWSFPMVIKEMLMFGDDGQLY